MRKELTKEIRKLSGESEFADRLIEITNQIEVNFQGDEKKRLLDLVHETLQRHLDIRQNTRRAHAALNQLEADHKTLLEFFDKIANTRGSETLH
jgi:hypothetical protein